MTDKTALIQRIRNKMGQRVITQLNPQEINDIFQRLHDRNKELEAKVESAAAVLRGIENTPFNCGCGYMTGDEAAKWMQNEAVKWLNSEGRL